MIKVIELKHTFQDNFTIAEHTLKLNGFMQAKQTADADFSSYSQALGEEFFEYIVQNKIAKTLISHPPSRLMATNEWEPMDNRTLKNTEELFLRGVKRVRNSITHGPKFLSDESRRSKRDITLTIEANDVLCEALLISHQKGIFKNFDPSTIRVIK